MDGSPALDLRDTAIEVSRSTNNTVQDPTLFLGTNVSSRFSQPESRWCEWFRALEAEKGIVLSEVRLMGAIGAERTAWETLLEMDRFGYRVGEMDQESV